MSVQLKLVFDKLKKWKNFPTYQLERRVDIYFGLLLPDILKLRWLNVNVDDVFPEFPITQSRYETAQSAAADFFCVSRKGRKIQPVLVELKTDSGSIDPKQKSLYESFFDKEWHYLANVFLYKLSKSEKWEKYTTYVKALKSRGLLPKEFPEEKINKRKRLEYETKWAEFYEKFEKVRIIYFLPNDSENINKLRSEKIEVINLKRVSLMLLKLSKNLTEKSEMFAQLGEFLSALGGSNEL